MTRDGPPAGSAGPATGERPAPARHRRGYLCVLALIFLALPCGCDGERREFDRAAATLTDAPTLRHYVAYRPSQPLDVDGKLDEQAWRLADWSTDFVDIEGADRPAPPWRTRVKLLWDDDFLYVAAELEEPHLWATLTVRDTVIYYDNDFELFLDPDGDTHNYYELEINALGTVWDLFLVKPYRDGGPAVTGWDIDGLRAAVGVQGTLNDPADRDTAWTVELAIPWAALAAGTQSHRTPRDGDIWRANFSRVGWQLEVVDGGYRKRSEAATGRPLPESNWVWSPQGAVNMHMPELWGVLQFSDRAVGAGSVPQVPLSDESVRWALRQIYYRQRAFYREQERFTADPAELGLPATLEGTPFPAGLTAAANAFEATATGSDGRTLWHIREDGKIWSE